LPFAAANQSAEKSSNLCGRSFFVTGKTAVALLQIHLSIPDLAASIQPAQQAADIEDEQTHAGKKPE